MADPDVFVITCNDSVEHVYIGKKNHAEQMKEGLATKYYLDQFRHERSRESYDLYVHWAVRPTPFTRGDGVIVSAEDRNG